MTKLTDAELQAIVYQTGIMPVDKLPKPDPKAELVSFLHQVSVSINGAVKCGVVKVRSPTFPSYSVEVMEAGSAVLQQLGYKVQPSGDSQDSIYLTISGWA